VTLAGLWAAIQRWYAGHSPRDQRIVQAVAAATVLSLVYVLVVEPLRDYRRQAEEEIAAGQEQLENDMRFLAAADALKAERLELSKRLAQAKKQLLPGDSGTLGAAALQERTSALAAEKGITVQSTQVMREEAADPFKRVAVRLTLSGEIRPLAEFLSGLEYDQQLHVPFLEVSRRGAVAGAKGPRTLQATVEVSGYVSEGGAARDGAAPEAEGEPPVPGEGAADGVAVDAAAPPEGPPPPPREPAPPPAPPAAAAVPPAVTTLPRVSATTLPAPPVATVPPPAPTTPPTTVPRTLGAPPVPFVPPPPATTPPRATLPPPRPPAPVLPRAAVPTPTVPPAVPGADVPAEPDAVVPEMEAAPFDDPSHADDPSVMDPHGEEDLSEEGDLEDVAPEDEDVED
jgi:type II secretory pathway component PulM